MHLVAIVCLLLAIISLAIPVRCDPASKQGFIFPRVSDPSIPDVFNLTVHINDSMVVEYTQLPHTTAIGITTDCFDTVQDAIRHETYDGGVASYSTSCK